MRQLERPEAGPTTGNGLDPPLQGLSRCRHTALTHSHINMHQHTDMRTCTDMHIPTRTDADLHTQIHTCRQAQILPHRATCMVMTHRCTHSHTPANTETHTYMLIQKRMHMDTFQQT